MERWGGAGERRAVAPATQGCRLPGGVANVNRQIAARCAKEQGGVVGPTNLSEMNRTMFKRGPITPPGVGPTTHAATLAHFSGQRVD
ncbi:hypothetical protein J6590_057200 [Homalodisca vitripennis]|nr:hypothetical protein J6590_057200 [Homalodisca vitripennis]